MSNYSCPYCGAVLIDSPRGYVTGCVHYPADVPEAKEGGANTEGGTDDTAEK